ncbi:MAG: hypothetical protein HYX79_10520 [Chloroflexi bacterium]|nr:hypothetical protein [Chloroflexota bacterium]
MTFALFLLIIYGVYGLAIFGAIMALRKAGVLPDARVVISFLLLGIAVGFVSYSMWPNDIGMIFNIPGALLGDRVYQWSILLIGDPSSSQAHFTILWILRIPQIRVVSSIVAWGTIGFLAQFVYDRIAALARSHKTY